MARVVEVLLSGEGPGTCEVRAAAEDVTGAHVAVAFRSLAAR